MLDTNRRLLMASTDSLLDRVEELRLLGLLRVTEPLRNQLFETGVLIDERMPSRPRTLAEAHRYLLGLQEPLLGGEGQRRFRRRPVVSQAEGGPAAIPLLTLPSRERTPDETHWREEVRLVVQRAHDMSSLLTDQGRAAGEVGGSLGARLTKVRSAQAAAAGAQSQRLLRQAIQATGRHPPLDPDPEPPDTAISQVAELVRVPLTPLERSYYLALAANRGRVLTREALVHLVHGDDPWVELLSRAPDVHLSRVRTKLGAGHGINAVPGIGYRWTGQAGERAAGQDAGAERRDERRAYFRRHQPAPNDVAPEPGPRPEIECDLG